jgi:hypothetical protein
MDGGIVGATAGGGFMQIRRVHVPLAGRIGFTVWMLIWVPIILAAQGPQNFLWLCNFAKFLILYSVWTGNLLLISSQAGTMVLVGLVWTLDLMVSLALGSSPTGFTDYMLNPELALSARLASLYHIGVPIFLIWLLLRVGYDRRGWYLQCVIGAVAVIGAWLLTEPRRNINWVYQPFGLDQPPLPEPVWVAVLVLALPLLIYLPGHFLVSWILSRHARRPSGRRA